MCFNQPTYLPFWKTLTGELGRLALITAPTATQHTHCQCGVALYNFAVSSFQMQFQNQQRQSCHCSWRYSLSNDSTLNVLSWFFICLCHYLCFLPLSPSTACNQTSLHDCLLSTQILLHMRSFPEHSGLMTSPYGNRLLPYMK